MFAWTFIGLYNYSIYSSKSKIIKFNTLIIGDSHPRTSIIPRYFKKARNVSQFAEPVIMSYWKYLKLTEVIKPDTVIFGFAPHNISSFNDYKFSSPVYSELMFSRSYPIISFMDLKGIDIDYFQFANIFWKKTLLCPREQHINYMGGYSNTDEINISDSIEAIERHYFFEGREPAISQSSLKFIDSIVNYSLNNSIVLIVVSQPVHPSYYKRIPDLILDAYEKKIEEIKKLDVTVVNRTDQFYPDSLYRNVDHLNKNGSVKFTMELMEEI